MKIDRKIQVPIMFTQDEIDWLDKTSDSIKIPAFRGEKKLSRSALIRAIVQAFMAQDKGNKINEGQAEQPQKQESLPKPKLDKNTPIEKIAEYESISTRLNSFIGFGYTIRYRKKIRKLKDLENITEEQVLKCRNVGIITLNELKKILNKYGVRFGK